MPSTYSNLKIQLMATGENNTSWGDVTNVNLGTAIDEAIAGSADVTFANANQTLTLTDSNASQTARNMRLNLTGSATTGYNLIVPSIEKTYIVNNGTDGSITVKNATGSGVVIPTGKTTWVYNNGTNVVDVVTYLTSLTLTTALPVASGGTGSNTAANARTALGVPGTAVANTFSSTQIISVNSATTALRITQIGAGNALLVEDSANPDSTPFVIDTNGQVGIGTTTPTQTLTVAGAVGYNAPVTVSTDTYTVTATDNWIIADNVNSVTLTLPSAAAYTGRILNVKTVQAQPIVSASSNVVPISSTTAGTVIVAATAGKFATLVSNGTNWVIMHAN